MSQTHEWTFDRGLSFAGLPVGVCRRCGTNQVASEDPVCYGRDPEPEQRPYTPEEADAGARDNDDHPGETPAVRCDACGDPESVCECRGGPALFTHEDEERCPLCGNPVQEDPKRCERCKENL